MPENKENKTKKIDSLMKHSKKIIIAIVAFSVVVSIAIVVAAWLGVGSEVAATYGDKKVLKSDYNDFKSKCEKFYNYSSDKDQAKKCSEAELEDLILRKALETEAETRGISVSDEDINKKYKALVEPYGSENIYLATIKQSFGYTPEYVKSNIKRDILKEKLAEYLLKEVSVTGVVVRYDWSGKDYDQNSVLAKEKLEKEFYPILKNGSNPEDIRKKIDEVVQRDGSPWNLDPVIALMPIDNLNEKSAQDKFAGKEDWAAISKLQKKGDVTSVLKSSAGYMVAYRLENSTSGQFSSWDEYKKDVVSKSKKYSFDYNYSIFKKTVYLKAHNIIAQAQKMMGVKNAVASDIDCSTQHFSRMDGYIVDASNTSHGVVASVRATPIGTPDGGDWRGEFPKCVSPQEGGDVTVNANYINSNGVNYYCDGCLQLGWQQDASQQYLSCWTRWDVTISKTGFQTVVYGGRSVGSNGITTYLDKPLGSHGKVNETYSGYYQAENTDNDVIIYLSPGAIPIGRHDGVEGDTVCRTWGWTCDPDNYSASNEVHICVDGVCDGGRTGRYVNPPAGSAMVDRPDIASSCGGYSKHGFNYIFPANDSIRDGKPHTIYAYGIDNYGIFSSNVLLPNSPLTITCSVPTTITSTCPTLTATPNSIERGDSITLKWEGGRSVKSINIKEQPTGSTTPIATINNVTPGGGTLDVVPQLDTTYTLFVTYTDNSTETCPAEGVKVKVRNSQSGTDRNVPPN